MDARFSLLAFPQRFDGANLELSILLIPRLSTVWSGNPLLPVIADFPNPGDTTPAFADSDWQLEARILSGLDRFPVNDPVDAAIPLPAASGARAGARQLFEELVAPLAGRFTVTADPPRLAEPVAPHRFIKKKLPRSYTGSFLFSGPRTPDAVLDDSYECAIKDATAPNPAFKVTPDSVSWGQIYAYCLRQPALARRLGLIRDATFPVDAAVFEKGGHLYVDLLPNSDYAAQVAADFGFLKRYAARIPALSANAPRPLFAAVLFPVLFDDPGVAGPPPVPGNFDAVFIEASDFDDGFAKIVHGLQPVSQNLLAEEADGFAPLTDIGIRLGWDDEQILIWQNRQLKEDPTVPVVPGDPQRLDAPMGVFAYRIDARELGGDWASLVRVRSLAPVTLGAANLGVIEGELGVEVHPMQLDGNQATGRYWLPLYMAQWNGKSLVLPDEDAAALFKTEQADGQAATLGRLYEPLGLEDISLRYGHTYEFRVRLMDPTGGGPRNEENPVQDGPAPVATVPFRRHVVAEPLRVAGLQTFPETPVDSLFADDSLEISRPLLGYPSVVFTGKYADPIPLLQAASDAMQGQESFGIPDPDVQRVRIDVEVRALKFDNKLSLSGREAYAHLYTTHRDFPADFAATLGVPLEFRDAAILNFGDPNDLGDLGSTVAEIDALEQIVLPRARDVRLTLRAVADEDPAYFAEGAHVGKTIQLTVRSESVDETGLLADISDARRIRGIYLQPDPPSLFDGRLETLLFRRHTGDSPAMIQRLAAQLGLDHKGLTLVGKKGERVVFGCSRRIRHTLAPDNSSLTFAAKEDLLNHWVVALTLQLERDWTWDNLEPVSFEIFREQRFQADEEVDDNNGAPVGDLEVVRSVPIQALDKPLRDRTILVFLDAVEPKSPRARMDNPAETRFPDVIELAYRVEPRFLGAPAASDGAETFALSLPVTTPPSQMPRLASAGIALSTYRRNESYSASEPRRRYLWLEFEEPVRDPNDAYFIRLLASSPDPLLSDNRLESYVPPEEPDLNIDPELMRVITPNQSDDLAGLDAMVQLEPAGNSDRHFLVPLPPGLHAEAPEMFGFFTYELRVGHATIWSTAQGRFGRALRSTGVQHPAPTLFCTTQRNPKELLAEAPYALAVLNGKNITADPPRTEIWALLYAQVRQADGKDYRNILLDDRKLALLPRRRGRFADNNGNLIVALQNRDAPARGATRWAQAEIVAQLRSLGLPKDSPLSVLCVEMLPGLHNFAPAKTGGGQGFATSNLASAVRSERSGAAAAAATAELDTTRPLSDQLGNFRILRTSPLTPVPDIC